MPAEVAEPPAAPPPPAPDTTPPVTPGERPQSEWMGDVEVDFADMDEGKTPEPKSRDDKGKFTKPAEKSAAKAPEKQPEKLPEKAPEKSEDKAPEQPEAPKPVRAAELRTAYEGLKKKVKEELEPEVQRLRSKVKEYETKQPEDTAPVLAKIKTLEERNAALEKHIALVDYEQSQEFSTKYDQPYRQMWAKATNAFNQLRVKENDGVIVDEVTGESKPKFKYRVANESDLIKLGALPLSELDEAAEAMFGASAPRAIQYIESLRDLATAKQAAVEEAKNKAGEWKSQRTLEQQNRETERMKAWTEVNKALEEKFPRAFKVEEGDADDKASHTKGFALANLLFVPAELTPEQVDALPASFRDTVKANKPLTDAQKVQLHAITRLKIANHDRKVAALKKAQSRIAELEKTLAEYEDSEPKATKAGKAAPTGGTKDWLEQIEQDMREIDR